MARRPDWVLGFADEVWWSRLAQPPMHSWAEPTQALPWVENQQPKHAHDPTALACSGVLLRGSAWGPQQLWLRFARGHPSSGLTTQFWAWCCNKLTALGVRAWVLIWDNASWHKSQAVRTWIRAPNRSVKQTGRGVRIGPCLLPSKSPWRNPIEPKWVHGKRAVMEPDRVLTAAELEARVYAYYGCEPESHLVIPENAA